MTTADEFSIRTWWEALIAKLPYFYVTVLLWALAFVCFWFPKISYIAVRISWLAGIVRPIGESLVVAGILVLLIDPFLKERLLREASRGIFHYLLGFDQQPEIKERLKKLVFDTTLFRRNYHMTCRFIPEQSGQMRLEIQSRFDVVNPTNEAKPFQHILQGERVENLTVRSLTLVSSEGNYTKTPSLQPKQDDPEVVEADGGRIQIQPSSKGLNYTFGTNFSMLYPMEFFLALNFSAPTIGVTIEVFPPEGFEITASATPTHTTNIWRYDKLFMPNEHIDLRWRKNASNSDSQPISN